MNPFSKTFVNGNIFSKKFKRKEYFREALLNSLEAEMVSKSSVVFNTPKVLNYDEIHLTINYEYLPDYEPVNTILRDFNYLNYKKEQLHKIFFNIGFGLAEYHIVANKIHGDLDSVNVLYKHGSNNVLFVDFARPKHANYPDYNKGSIYKDLALFFIFIKTKYPISKTHYALRETNMKLCLELFKGYFTKAENLEFCYSEFNKEYKYYLEETYLSRNFLSRFFKWSRIFNCEELIYEYGK